MHDRENEVLELYKKRRKINILIFKDLIYVVDRPWISGLVLRQPRFDTRGSAQISH
jgi:hypothetical protein